MINFKVTAEFSLSPGDYDLEEGTTLKEYVGENFTDLVMDGSITLKDVKIEEVAEDKKAA